MAISKQPNRPWFQALDLWLLDSTVILLPSYLIRFHIGSLGFNLFDGVITLAFIGCVLYHHGVNLTSYWKWTMFSFLVISALAVWTAPDTIIALGLFKSYCVMPMLVGIMVLTIRPTLSHLTTTISIVVSYISIVALIQYLTGFGIPAPWNLAGADYRVTSVFDYPNAVGLILAPLVIWLLATCIHNLKRSWWVIVAGGLGIIAIVISRSDGAIVALVVSFVFTGCYTKYRWPMLMGTGLLIVIALFIPITREIVLFQDTSGEVRLALWQGTLDLLRHHPWLGAGLGGFPALYAEYKLARHVELLLYPHNIFLDFWVEFGIFGLGWLIVVLVQFFKNLTQQLTSETLVLLSVMVGILVYGLVDVPYFKNDLAVLFWIIITIRTVLVSQPHNKIIDRASE